MKDVSEMIRLWKVQMAGIDMLEGKLRSERKTATDQISAICSRLRKGETTGDVCEDAIFLLGHVGNKAFMNKLRTAQDQLQGKTGQLFVLVYHDEKKADDMIKYLRDGSGGVERAIRAPEQRYDLEQRIYLGFLSGDSLVIDGANAVCAPTKRYAEVHLHIGRRTGKIKPGNLPLNDLIGFLNEPLELQDSWSQLQLGNTTTRLQIIIGEPDFREWGRTYSGGRYDQELLAIARDVRAALKKRA